MKRRDLLLLTTPLIGGCITLPWEDHELSFSYPKDINDMCHRARKDALARIKSIDGKTPKLKSDGKVEKVAGQRFIANCWCFFSKIWNLWVAGLCHLERVVRIQIGAHPQTGGQIHYEILVHENGHYGLWDEYGIYTHPSKYQKVFQGWRDPPKARSMISFNSQNELVLIDGFEVDENNPAPTEST